MTASTEFTGKQVTRVRTFLIELLSEFNLLTGLDHECIVKYYDLIETNYEEILGIATKSVDGDSSSITSTSSDTKKSLSTPECSPPGSPSSSLSSYSSSGVKDGKIYLVMEWLGDGCNLTSWLRNSNQSINCVREILKKLFEAMVYLQSKEIAHHDIKLDNIIYNERNGSLKIIDFGVSEVCLGDESYSAFGTPAYQAPEILTRSDASKAISGHKSDMWSIGVVAYQLGNKEGRLPFEGDSVMQVFDGIINNEPDLSVIKDFNLKDLIKKLLKKDPKERITAAEALHHPFIKGEASENKWTRLLQRIKNFLS